jgi:hypothetical protein
VWLNHKIEKKKLKKKKPCSDHDLEREWGIYNVLEEIQNNLGGGRDQCRCVLVHPKAIRFSYLKDFCLPFPLLIPPCCYHVVTLIAESVLSTAELALEIQVEYAVIKYP